MEAAARREQRDQQRGAAADGGRSLSGQSYWLDLWLFVLFDLALFVVIYLLP
uniref:HCV F-transactivated protein 1 n=1 Tax=Calidris pygmaea TaxID=425635 RepID=A0A8C3KNZ5_9CHAR